ncbi:MAG: hypothetical protein JWL96_3650 [Sphingomonas bacterium]|nr:hypothetical protein [Sphingomonas bacterium]
MGGGQLSERHALVIGVDAYLGARLDNGVLDASKVAETLRRRAFSVTAVLNPDRDTLVSALSAFSEKIRVADWALIYLAGHAVERYGAGYFLPVDMSFPPTPSGLLYGAIGLNEFIAATDGARSRVVVLDACRDWPENSNHRTEIATDLEALSGAERDWPNLLLAYATSATTRAGDGVHGEGSAFTDSLCRNILKHSLAVDECFRHVAQDVVARRRQQPWTYSSLQETLSFSDLPRFAAIQRHATPNPEQLSSAWAEPNAFGDGVVVGMGDTRIWHFDLRGLSGIRHRGTGRFVGAANLEKWLLLAESTGKVFVGGNDRKPIVEVKVDPTFGLTAAPNGCGAVHYGAGIVTIMEEVGDQLKIASTHDVGFHVYCCTYLPDGAIWVAGGQGRVCEIDASGVREVCRLRQHINSLAPAPNGSRVFAVGQHGLAVELDRAGQVVTELLKGRPLATAAGIRAELLNTADDEFIYEFIFNRAAVPEEMVEQFEERVGYPDYLGCAHSPEFPMLAIGTQESTVLLIDTRDGQVVQEIDIGSGHTTVVSGLHFLKGGVLVVVDGRGHVTFFQS